MTTTTVATELLPLLQKLAELQPEFNSECLQWGKTHRFRLSNPAHTIDVVEGVEQSAIDFAILQWALQVAIAAHGFVIDAEMYCHADTQALRWDVFVYDKGRIAIDGSSFRCDSANPAIALIQAYVSALEEIR